MCLHFAVTEYWDSLSTLPLCECVTVTRQTLWVTEYRETGEVSQQKAECREKRGPYALCSSAILFPWKTFHAFWQCQQMLQWQQPMLDVFVSWLPERWQRADLSPLLWLRWPVENFYHMLRLINGCILNGRFPILQKLKKLPKHTRG